MPRNEDLIWYETGLPPQERKQRGHFSTPPTLVNQMLDACGYTAAADLTRLRVLDPACGSGNFLAGAAQRLLAGGAQRGYKPRQTLSMLQRNVWGFDPDPVACFLAEMQVRATFAEQELTASERTSYAKRPLHIQQADGLALPWGEAQRETVDLFLANPPYLAAKNADLSGYRWTQGLGQADSYLLFLRLALQVVRPDGWLGLVLPDPVLARANATRERQRLLAETTVHQLWHLANVFPAYVGAVVIIAQKRPPKHLHQVTWVREKWSRHDATPRAPQRVVAASQVTQTLLHLQAGAELCYLLGNEHGTLLERLHLYMARQGESRGIVPLYRVATIRRGEELGKKSVLLLETPPNETGWHPLLRGGVDVRPYGIPQGRCWIAEHALGKPLTRYQAPKLLIVKSTSTLQAALDTHGHIALQTLYLLMVDEDEKQRDVEMEDAEKAGQERGAEMEDAEKAGQGRGAGRPQGSPLHVRMVDGNNHLSVLDTLYFLLALLNSRLLQQYVYVLHTAYKLVQPQIEQHVLARLPIPLVDPMRQQEIIERAKKIMFACGAASPVVELSQQQLCEEQERAICALYERAIQL